MQFDPEGFGEISVEEFLVALKSPEFLSQVPMNKRELLLERAKKAKLPTGPGYVTFQDFVNVVSVPCAAITIAGGHWPSNQSNQSTQSTHAMRIFVPGCSSTANSI